LPCKHYKTSVCCSGPDITAAQFPKSQKPREAAELATGKIRGLADLGRSDDESGEDDSNEYYTGGEKSGMVSLSAPPLRNENMTLWDVQRESATLNCF